MGIDLYVVSENCTEKQSGNPQESIYTRDKATDIVGLFEDVLSRYDIHVPSPEDDEREDDNMIGLFGSTYSDLLDSVEDYIAGLLQDAGAISQIITDEFS